MKTCNITGSDCMMSLRYCNDSLKMSNSMLHVLQSIRDLLLLRRAVPLLSLQDACSSLLPPSDLMQMWLRSQNTNPATAPFLNLTSEGQIMVGEKRKMTPFGSSQQVNPIN